MATRRAVVVAAEPGSIDVTLAPGCASCSGCAGACAGLRRRWQLATNDVSLRPGHEITVHVREQVLRRLAFAAYGAWLLGLVAGALAGALSAPLVMHAGGPHDFWVFACAAAGTYAGFRWSHRRFRAATVRGEFLNVQLEEQD